MKDYEGVRTGEVCWYEPFIQYSCLQISNTHQLLTVEPDHVGVMLLYLGRSWPTNQNGQPKWIRAQQKGCCAFLLFLENQGILAFPRELNAY